VNGANAATRQAGEHFARLGPTIHLREDQLTNLAAAIERKAPDLSRLILHEIGRAELHGQHDLADDIVAIGSEVEFEDAGSHLVRRVTLVMPAEADLEAGKVSVLTPVGIGLMGLRQGEEHRVAAQRWVGAQAQDPLGVAAKR
jgi:regulator of nucleoside diphosphate kinase